MARTIDVTHTKRRHLDRVWRNWFR